MKSIVRAFVLAMLLVAGSRGRADDQIRWAPDFRTACQLAADQHRLVLLHFYGDNCEPCVRVERNVFSQPQVGEALAANYLPVKIHVSKEPQLANRYRVRSWPTDVFVTPTGLEVYRSNSPQKPEDYIALVNQVAQQTGISTSRQWVSKLGDVSQPAAAAATAAAATANQAASGVRQATDQAAVTAQDGFTQGQQRWNAALDQFKAASDQARAASSQTTQQFMDGARQTQQQAAATGQQWSQQATDAVQSYEQQGGEAYRQFREQTTQASQNVQQQAQQVHQDVRGTAEQLTDVARSTASRWQQTFSQTQSPAATTTEAATPASTAAAPAAEKPAAEKPASPAPPLLPTENPWMAARQSESAKPAAAPEPTGPSSTASSAPPLLAQTAAAAPATESPASAPTAPPPTTPPAPSIASSPPTTWQSPVSQAAPPPTQPSQPQVAPRPAAGPPSFAPGQLVPASQAPPVAMDGFCPVSLVETVSRDPHDRAAWKKGNPKFGAIHRGRTYMFTSAEQQQKFLANPDAYAPVLSGCDPVAFAERGELLDGKRAYGLITPDKRIYLFADEGALRKFNQSPGSYAATAQQAMLRNDGGNVYR